jgi:hypothetical protein
MIVEEGEHKMLDGSVIVAGKTKVGGKWKGIDYGTKFTKTPAVFT